MNWTAYKCTAGYTRVPHRCQRYRGRSVTVFAKNEQKQPSRDEPPQDKRKAPVTPIAGNKALSNKPVVQAASSPNDNKIQRDPTLRSESAMKDKREAGGTSVAQPPPSLRQHPETRKSSLDDGWGPVEQGRDAIGVILTAAFVLGAFALTTILFRAIGGYRAANMAKLQLRQEAGTATVKEDGAESEKYWRQSQVADKEQAGQATPEQSSSRDAAQTSTKAGTETQPQAKEAMADENYDEDDATSADSGSDADHVTNIDVFDHDHQDATMHDSTQGQDHQQGLSLAVDTSASNTGDPGMADSAPAAGASEEEYLDSDMSISTLKQKVSTAMRASALAADASKAASGWSASAAEASQRAAVSAERASAAASRAQHSLQGAAEADAHDLASRIANAEAAVEQAEQAAAEAVRSQDEASRAATMADKHYMDAADQSETVFRNSKLDLNRGHGVQSILYSCQSWVQGQWQHLLQIIASASRWLSENFNIFGDRLQQFWMSVRDSIAHAVHAVKKRIPGQP